MLFHSLRHCLSWVGLCLLLGALLFDSAEARKKANQSRRTGSSTCMAFLDEGRKLVRAEKFPQAEAYYDGLLKSWTTQPSSKRPHQAEQLETCKNMAHQDLVYLYIKSNQLSKAKAGLNHLLSMYQQDKQQVPMHQLLFLSAEIARKEGALEKAVDLYREVIRLNDEQPTRGNFYELQALTGLVDCYEQLDRPEAAAEAQHQLEALNHRWKVCEGLPDSRFESLLKTLQPKIKKHWQPPLDTIPRQTVLIFWLAQDGSVTRTEIKQSSGNPAGDRQAVLALQNAAPFDKMPVICEKSIPVQYTFNFEPSQSK